MPLGISGDTRISNIRNGGSQEKDTKRFYWIFTDGNGAASAVLLSVPSVASRHIKAPACAPESREAFSQKNFFRCLVNEKNFLCPWLHRRQLAHLAARKRPGRKQVTAVPLLILLFVRMERAWGWILPTAFLLRAFPPAPPERDRLRTQGKSGLWMIEKLFFPSFFETYPLCLLEVEVWRITQRGKLCAVGGAQLGACPHFVIIALKMAFKCLSKAR